MDITPQCQALVALGADKVLLPAGVTPACFVTPQSVADVSAVVKSLTSSSSCLPGNNNGNANFAVRSGGHAWFAGANSASGGITIDLRGLNSVDLSPDNSSVSIGAGATWDAVYAKLDPLGLSVAGGQVAGVGVGGLTLGGGISYFGPREGWTCNQATSFEVVLADGTVVEADESQNADLWWGLRGGSNNFGIVTRVTLRTFKQGLLWSRLVVNPITELDNQARICSELMAADNYDINAYFLTGWGFISQLGVNVIVHQMVYTRPDGNEPPAFFKPILDLPDMAIPNVTGPAVVANMSTHARNSVALQQPQAARYMRVSTTIVPTEAMLRASYDAFNASIPRIEGLKGINWAINIEPLPPQLYARHDGKNALGLGLTKHKGSLAVFLVSPSWTDAAHDDQVYDAARALIADVEARAKEMGAYQPYIYLNYAAPWQDVIRSYGEESVKKLQQLRKRVDPDLVFTRQVKGGFKIPEGDGEGE